MPGARRGGQTRCGRHLGRREGWLERAEGIEHLLPLGHLLRRRDGGGLGCGLERLELGGEQGHTGVQVVEVTAASIGQGRCGTGPGGRERRTLGVGARRVVCCEHAELRPNLGQDVYRFLHQRSEIEVLEVFVLGLGAAGCSPGCLHRLVRCAPARGATIR